MAKIETRIVSLLLCILLLVGVMPMAALAYDSSDEDEYQELPVPVTTEGKTYSLCTDEYLDDTHGTSYLYVIKSGGRFYTLAHPNVGGYSGFDSVAAVDITEYWDAETNTFSNIPDSANVGAMQYQMYPFPSEWSGASGLFLDGDIMFSLSVPFENNGEKWFGTIEYYSRYQTYSYSRALWHANGDGSGYMYDSYIDWYNDSDEWIYGALDLYTASNGTKRFALLNVSDEYNNDEEIPVTAYLYSAPCGHISPEYSAYVAPTCMDKGCEEYWYCKFCMTYFYDEDCKTSFESFPVIPALGHDYGETECKNCNRPVPVYTKISSYDQFTTIGPGASFIAVAEIDDGNGGKDYYVLKMPKNYVSADANEDGMPDILDIDEDSNGVADILEVDSDGDGIADAMAFDGFWSEDGLDGVLDEDEIEQYLFELEMQYTNGYMVDVRALDIIKVTPDAEGNISVKDLDALEFIMDRRYTDEEIESQYFGDGITKRDYENDFYFRIPNFWVRPMVTIDNNYYGQGYDFGDCKFWGVLFAKEVKEMDEYRAELFADYPDDAAILYTESFGSKNDWGEIEHGLRFLINGENKNFIITSESFWEEVEGTQIPIYLYSSDAGMVGHTHSWSPWTKVDDEKHKRVCTAEDCDAFDLAGHAKDEEKGCRPETENVELGHWVTCTDCEAEYHEFHTRQKYNYRYPNLWKEAEDGIHHVVYCTVCKGPAAYEEHKWGEWSRAEYYDSATQSTIWKHIRSCSEFPCPADQWRDECIYDEGTVTKAPTCEEPGIITYKCIASDCQLETNTYTEEIPAIGHDWGEWQASDDPTKEERICKNDASHTEERISHEHTFGDWVEDDTTDEHIRRCSYNGCTAYESEPHKWDDGVQTKVPTCTEEGVITYTCSDCDATKTDSVAPLDHDWNGWEYDSDDSHTRTCKRNCGEQDYGGHEWGEWTDSTENEHEMICSVCKGNRVEEHNWSRFAETKAPTCTEEGILTHYCSDCDATKDEVIEATDHNWSDWRPEDDSCHSRTCFADCGAYETEDHSWDDGKVTVEPTCTEAGERTYTCKTCSHTKTEEIPTVDHEWSEWKSDGNGEHVRYCRCNASESDECEYGDGVVTKEPTHLDEGEMTYTCNVCKDSYVKPIERTADHNWSDWASADGETHIRECKCGEIETDDHSFGEWTELDNGRHKRGCTVCDAEEFLTLDNDKPVNTTPDDNAANTNLNNSDFELIDKILTDEEQSKVAAGEDVKIYLKVEDISADAPIGHKAEVEAAAGDSEVSMYLDIELFKQIGNGEETKVSELGGTVTVTITIPESLINTDGNVIRTYKIIRVHEDENGNLITDVIEGIFNPEDNSFTFETDRFSTYALAYSDEQQNKYKIGDVNGDGEIDKYDYILVKRSVMGTISLDADQTAAADINGDGILDKYDYILLKRCVMGNYKIGE